MPRSSQSINASVRWAVRLIPLFILAIFAVAIYAVVSRLCIDYIYRKKNQTGVAAVFLALFFLFLVLTLATYVRAYIAVQRDPGLVPLPLATGPERKASDKSPKSWRRRRARSLEDGVWSPPDPNPDSPGLEEFYSKDIFVCEADGRPRWCSECRSWKPDRAHHSSELGRCVRKMDHFCPWIGGMVAETSFNFFAQFTFYCTLLCIVSIAVGAYSLRQRNSDGQRLDGWMLAPIILGCLFGTFACGMALSSFRFILKNITNVDVVRRSHTITLAIRIPRTTPPSEKYSTIVYPLRGSRNDESPHEMNIIDALSMRDQRAERKFAILRTQPRENPWNLGLRENWKSVMGNNLAEWLLPLSHSPCCDHESMESDYKYGPLISQLRKRYGVPDIHAPGSRHADGMEMQAARKERSH